MTDKIAALFVETDGIYFSSFFKEKYKIEIEPWDIVKDARSYSGPYPIIAHPPCERWGRYWYGGPMCHKNGCRKILGDDNGCFASALENVRKWGGILEHPEASHAWKRFGLNRPHRNGGWIKADEFGGWTCCVEQGHYGHRSRKKTWLYANRVDIPELKWGPALNKIRLEERVFIVPKKDVLRDKIGIKPIEKLSKQERAATPIEFAELLVSIVKTKFK